MAPLHARQRKKTTLHGQRAHLGSGPHSLYFQKMSGRQGSTHTRQPGQLLNPTELRHGLFDCLSKQVFFRLSVLLNAYFVDQIA
jgi:hypothetical protein